MDTKKLIKESVIAENTTNISTLTTNLSNEAEARTQADAELQTQINLKQDALTAGDNIKIENNVISAIDATKLSVNITWSELKALRDNSRLVSGTWYRITDYTCTTIPILQTLNFLLGGCGTVLITTLLVLLGLTKPMVRVSFTG